MSELVSQIRDYINKPRKRYLLLQDNAKWNLLCSSMDTLEDKEIAIDAYLIADEPKTDGDNCLALTGVLDSLFVQQDALQHLAESLAISYEIDPVLSEIREIRNNSTGHPTKRGGGTGRSFNFIQRNSITKESFDLMTTYPNDEPKFQKVNIIKLIESQKSIVESTLSNVINTLKEEEIKHKEEFMDKKLADVFPPTLGYYFEKIHEAIRDEKPKELGLAFIKSIADVINDFKFALEERGIFEAYDSVGYSIEELKYPIEELDKFFQDNSESIRNENDANIFAFFIAEHIDNLIQMAKELDDEYADSQ